jgi:putative heme-binding domain-containing protein
MNCCIWRYHPERDVFEIVAEGGTNSWGFDFDQHGEMFFTNTVIGHLFHVVPGARYNRMYGSHFNPYTWQTIDQTADHVHWGSGEKWFDAKKGVVGDAGTGSDATDKAGGGHAHSGFMIYQGDNWPAEYRGRAFTLNFHGRRMNQERLERAGSSYIGKHESDMFQSADPWFRGVELMSGPDGAVYVLDWSDIGECHENDGIHRTSGRIFKIAYGKTSKPEFEDLNELSDKQLVALMEHDNVWYPRMAQRILADRNAAGKDCSSDEKILLKTVVQNWTGERSVAHRLRALWLLNELGELAPKSLLELFKESDDEHIRVWCLRLLTDYGSVDSNVAAQMIEMAGDKSSLVRHYVASGLDHMDSVSVFEAANVLAANEVDMKDRVQPKLLWQRVEPFIVGDFDRSMSLFDVCKSQMLRQNIARRLACDPELQNEMLERLVQRLLGNATLHRADLLHGIKSAIEGRKKMDAPESWSKLAAIVPAMDAASAKLVEEISPVFGDGLSMERLMNLASDRDAEQAARQQAIISLAQFAEPSALFPMFKDLIRDRLVSESVAKSFSVCDQDEVASLILNQYKRLSDQGKRNAIDTLCSRKKWAKKFLTAVGNGRVEAESITAWHARQINLFDDATLTAKLAEVWGRVRATDSQKLQQMERLREIMTAEKLETANLANGKKLFATNCATCHAVFGEGGNNGPDLTGADRKNLNYLLENIVDPSASVATSYRASVLALEDGRLLTGVVLDRTPKTLKLQTQDELLTIETDSIEEIRQTELSLMPEELLGKLTDSEKVDLFGYLMSNGVR